MGYAFSVENTQKSSYVLKNLAGCRYSDRITFLWSIFDLPVKNQLPYAITDAFCLNRPTSTSRLRMSSSCYGNKKPRLSSSLSTSVMC